MNGNNQKIEILEAQCKDFKEREESLKNLNNSIMLALNDLTVETERNSKKKINKEMEILEKKHEQESKKNNEIYESKLRMMENQIAELNKEKQEIQESFNDYIEKKEQVIKDFEQQFKNIFQENANLKFKLKSLEDETNMSKNSALSESVFKLNNLNSEIEKMRLLSTKEKEDMEAQYKTEIISLKYLHEKEILAFQSKFVDLTHEKNLLGKTNSQNLKLFEELKQKLYEEITTLKAEKTILMKDQEELQHTFTKYQSQGIECESNLQKDISKLKEMNRMALEENKRLRSKIISFQTSMKSFEKSEKSLKIVLHERDLLFESERQDFKKQLSYEKTKSDRMQKLACEIKDDYLRKHALLIQESLTKDETIKKLTGSLIRLSAKASQKTPLDQKNNKSQASCNKENREIELLKTNEIEGSATQRTNEEALTTKSRNKSYSACNNSKSKSCLSGQNEENIEGLKKIDLGKLEGKRSISRLKNMRKESYYDKKAGISHQIGKNLSLRVIHDFENKTVFLKNL